jgi:hypothetical protein
MNVTTTPPIANSGAVTPGSTITVAQIQHKIGLIEQKIAAESEGPHDPLTKLQVTQLFQAEIVALTLQVQKLNEAREHLRTPLVDPMVTNLAPEAPGLAEPGLHGVA